MVDVRGRNLQAANWGLGRGMRNTEFGTRNAGHRRQSI